MSCITFSREPIGGVWCSHSTGREMSASAIPFAEISADVSRIGGISVSGEETHTGASLCEIGRPLSFSRSPIAETWVAHLSLSLVRASSRRIGSLSVIVSRDNGLSVSATRKGGISARMWQECAVNPRQRYLEISPTIVWVLNGWTSNEVYSNTTWIVE